jgi:hypothetical protein
MLFTNFLKKGFLLFFFFAIFLFFLQLIGQFKSDFLAAWTGIIISLINFLIGSAIIAWGTPKSDKRFYSMFFIGMLLRFALIFIALFILIKIVHLSQLFLAGSLLISYFGFMGLEVWIVYKSDQQKGTV